jgi:hypothetical protein
MITPISNQPLSYLNPTMNISSPSNPSDPIDEILDLKKLLITEELDNIKKVLAQTDFDLTTTNYHGDGAIFLLLKADSCDYIEYEMPNKHSIQDTNDIIYTNNFKVLY